MKIMLFDIDGTIIKMGTKLPDGKRLSSLFGYSIKKVFGVDVQADSKKISGNTDRKIFFDLMSEGGISRAEGEKHIDELMAIGTEYIRERIDSATITPADGVEPTLISLKNNGYHLGLLTGNIEKVAEMKLTKTGLMQYFEFGGFGSMSETRSKLIDYAIDEAEKKFNAEISKREVFYFGDTQKDIIAGQEAGVVTIAIPGGYETKDELSKFNPDYIVESIGNTDQILKIIEGLGK